MTFIILYRRWLFLFTPTFSPVLYCLVWAHCYLKTLQTALIPFITAGDPDLATTAKALRILDACGSDVIELGVPYSDPLADGPVIQVGWYASTDLFVYRVCVLSMYAPAYSSVLVYAVLGLRDTRSGKRHHIWGCHLHGKGGDTWPVLPCSAFHILQPDSEAWCPQLHEYC